MTTKIQEIFRITDFFDEARWESESHKLERGGPKYRPINYYRDDLPEDVKLLTHWICYITDRQMPFQVIWDKAGFVFSNLLDEIIKRKHDLDIVNKLLEPDGVESFFLSRTAYQQINKAVQSNSEEGYVFAAKVEAVADEIWGKYADIKPGIFPYFTSRFYPTDYFSILSTLYILEDFDFSLAKFIVSLIRTDEKEIIKRIVFGLYLLTYYNVKRKNSSDLGNFNILKTEAKKRKNDVIEILKNEEKFRMEYGKFLSSRKYFTQKRAWCSLRDYFKSKYYREQFICCLKEESQKAVKLLFDQSGMPRQELLLQFELPGDVWNNNTTFRKCVFSENGYNENVKPLAEYLRELFDVGGIEVGYPEQFDITFDHAPRMCANAPHTCSVCPYGLLNGKARNFDQLCINDTSKYCPVVYVASNYTMLCKGENCPLLIMSYKTSGTEGNT